MFVFQSPYENHVWVNKWIILKSNLITGERFSYPLNNVKPFIKTDLTSRTMQSPLERFWEGVCEGDPAASSAADTAEIHLQKTWEWDSLQQVSPWVQSVSNSVSHTSFPISVIDVFRDPKTYWWERSMRGRLGKRKTSASWLCRQPQPNIYHSFRSVAGFPSKGL